MSITFLRFVVHSISKMNMIITNRLLSDGVIAFMIITIGQNENRGKAASSTFLRFGCFLNEANGLSLIKRCIEFMLTIATRTRT